jgi:hypothetical protein
MVKYSYYLVLASLLYIIVAIFSINKPLTLDQADPVAENAGAIAHFGFDALGSKDKHYEIAHPTLHHHLLAMVFMIFGESTFTATRRCSPAQHIGFASSTGLSHG